MDPERVPRGTCQDGMAAASPAWVFQHPCLATCVAVGGGAGLARRSFRGRARCHSNAKCASTNRPHPVAPPPLSTPSAFLSVSLTDEHQAVPFPAAPGAGPAPGRGLAEHRRRVRQRLADELFPEEQRSRLRWRKGAARRLSPTPAAGLLSASFSTGSQPYGCCGSMWARGVQEWALEAAKFGLLCAQCGMCHHGCPSLSSASSGLLPSSRSNALSPFWRSKPWH